MNVFDEPRFRLLRLAARFRPTPESNLRSVSSSEVASVIDGLMSIGLYADEFAYLESPELNYFEMLRILEGFLASLRWKPLSEEQEFRFLTAVYAEVGARDDHAAYHAIIRWMEDVGREMDESFCVQFVADGIEAEQLYGCYYSYSALTGGDLIPSVEDPQTHDWSMEGGARPKKVFAEWLAAHPNDKKQNRPFDEDLLDDLYA
ncbi:hypothetical protein K3X41_09310 [Aliiroseovarius crassostreae]|uniref:hypothetical protein n=1 Tax=Aliiroseovarius crassostreae TaxID=154981 RepID=UPI002203586F|nr:hypothetical protein [Aliiroseovarius crassostreae]UWQ10133.1 hypothetical protein K3X41_09310 [Aliiroseovarius crassostreae]